MLRDAGLDDARSSTQLEWGGVAGLQPLHGNADLAHLGGPLWAPRGLAAWADTPPHPFP